MRQLARSSRALALCALTSCVALQSGCGVIFGYGNPQPVEVSARLPSGDLVPGLAISDRGQRLQGTSGETVYLHPAESHALTIEDPRYRSAQQAIVKSVRVEVVLLDALTLGIGLLVDYLSGSLYALQPRVTISVRPVEEAERLTREARADSARRPVPSSADPGSAPSNQPERSDGIWVEDLDDPQGKRVFLPNDAARCSACDGLRGSLRTCPHCGAQ